MTSDDLSQRLKKLEKNLEALLLSTREDLEIAQALQKQLFKERLPQIKGLKCLARYISASELSSDYFDIFGSLDGRHVWMITAWTESFGLSSILLQALMRLQAQAVLEKRPHCTPEEVFTDISMALVEAKKSAKYRLMVTKIDMSNLQASGVAIGMPCLLKRVAEKNSWGGWESIQPEPLIQHPGLLEPALSAAPNAAAHAYHFTAQIKPGSRLFFVSPSWNPQPRLESLWAPLELSSTQAAAPQSELLDDLNWLCLKAEESQKNRGYSGDLTVIAMEFNARLIHLA